MLRALLAFMILVLAMSHGSLGAAAPHVEGEHSHASVHQNLDDHGQLATNGGEDQTPEGSVADGKAEVSHVHLSVDALPRGGGVSPNMDLREQIFAVRGYNALPSKAVAPLLEPPSA